MNNRHSPIAVVGVSALFPGSVNREGFWRDILAGTDLISPVPASHWLLEDYYDPDPNAPDKTYAQRGGFLPTIDFDALGWGVPPSIVPATDTAQLLALIVAERVLDDATRGQFADMDKDKVSVILGVTSAQELLASMVSRLQRPVWEKSLREMGLPESQVLEACQRMSDHYVPWQEATFPGLLGNVVAGRIANRLDLGGTNCVTDAACASTFSALSMAVNELTLGQSDLVVTGGVDTMNDIFMYMCFSKTPALSKSGDCAPFSDKADGTLLGEGLGMVALKRLEDAERDGDRIYAVVRGVGSSSDGRSKSVYAPLPQGQAKALRRAYEAAGYGPDTVELVEAHGTGTKAGDAAEFEGLTIAFGESGREDRGWCALGSVKSQIGHAKAAAGAAGLFKAVMALQHKVLPPTIKVERPNPKLELDTTPFYINTRSRPWVRGSAHPRRAGVSSFGFGGSNFHLTLEEWTGAEQAGRLRTAPVELVLLSAQTPEELVAACRAVEQGPAGFLRWFAYDGLSRYDATKPCRLALLPADEADLVAKLTQAAEHIAANPDKALSTPTGTHYARGEVAGDVGFLFPGQGSQYIDMGAEVAMALPQAIAAWDVAADVDMSEAPLHHVVFPKPEFDPQEAAANAELLTETRWAQPAIGAASLALLRVMRSLGVEPSAVGGHSFGEVIALHAAGAFDEATALRIARRRGELMGEAAVNPGAMTACSARAEQISELLAQWGLDVVIANHNSPTQVVISGPTEAIEQAELKLAEANVTARRLPVATAFHSKVVSASTVPFRAFLDGIEITEKTIPAWANATAEPYPAGAEAVRELLSSQIASSVRFVEQVEAMHAAGVRTFVEVGPGSVLSGLVKRILRKADFRVINLDRKGRDGLQTLFEAVGQLAVAGLALQPLALWEGYRVPEDPRAKQAPRFALPINGSNYGKPYPPPGGAAELPGPNPEPAPVERPEPEVIVKEVIKEVVREVPVEVPVDRQSHHPGAPAAPAAPIQSGGLSPLAPAEQQSWLNAFQQLQHQTAQAHQSFQQSMAQTHQAFLSAVSSSFQGLTALATGQGAGPVAARSDAQHFAEFSPSFPASSPRLAAPVAAAPVSRAPVAPAPAAPAPAAWSPPAISAIPEPTHVAPRVQPAAPPSPVTPRVALTPAVDAAPVAAPAPTPAAPALDLHGLLMEVVSEKTGYPQEMLSPEMGLEADLGIDSIKRVEILSAMRERAPELPEVDAGEMASLTTLGQIIDYMGAQLGNDAAPAGSAVVTPLSAAPALDLHGLLMEVVSEKTGYPQEMLSPDMGLEADLGIDSIKRVEILSAMRERAPELPEVDAGEMASLTTLGQIISYMGAQLGPAAASPSAEAPTSTASSSLDLHGLLMEVVSEKTGYPQEMLSPDMGLESDLGIDSIKRVEILSAMRERAPELPEVDAGEMASLTTLGQIIEYMQKALGGPNGPDDGPGAKAPAPSAGQADAVGQGAAAEPSAGRFSLAVVDAPAAGFALRGLSSAQAVEIVDGGSGVAGALAAALGQRGLSATVVEAASGAADALIDLRGLAAVSGLVEAAGLQRAAFQDARAIAPRLSAQGGAYAVVMDLGGDFGLSGASLERAWLGGLPGLAKTAALEWPKAGVKAVDIERGGRSPEALAEALVNELLAGGPEKEVGLSADGGRVTLVSQLSRNPGGAPAVDAQSVIVASGGAKGVTADCVIALAKRSKARFVLLGRSALAEEPAAARGVEGDANLKRALLQAALAAGRKVSPPELGREVSRVLSSREIRATLAAIQAAGGDAIYASADVSDASSVQQALTEARARWGPITGLVHGAGVLADKRIAEKTDAQFDLVFDTKVKGLDALLTATSADPLRAVCLFSSVAGRSGNLGQSDYAMANEVLNKVADALAAQRPGLLVKSMGWGPWEGGMVTPALKAHFESMGVPLIAIEAGARAFADELLGSPRGQVELVISGDESGATELGVGDGGPQDAYTLRVNAAGYPYLADHSIRGTPVVPVVLVLEWFARAARALKPGLRLRRLQGLRVLRGVKVADFEGQGVLLQVRAKQLSNGDGAKVELELRGADGGLHYAATAELGLTATDPGASHAKPALGPWSSQIYGGTLFHGPEFQVIRAMEGVSEEGIAAELATTVDQGWAGPTWATDVAALDGGLQLALLWTREVLGGDSLPTSVGAYETYGEGVPAGPVRAELSRRQVGDKRTVSDIRFTSADGRLLSALLGVETHLLPSA